MYEKGRVKEMKATLVENLISAHCSGKEKAFSEALDALASDEEKKGNTATAFRLRSAYKADKCNEDIKFDYMTGSANFFSAQVNSIAPRDKDSLLELYDLVQSDVSLSDVVLADSQKKIINQVISEQRNALTLIKHNMVPMNRILFCGPPGCGKTMTAYAIGHELELPIAYVRLDGLVSSYLGQTSTNLRKIFDSVRNRRLILFLDEFDAIAKKRDDSNELGELKRVVTTLLQNFDNLPTNVILIAATNHEQLLDPAIWRRFNATITLSLPEESERLELIEKEIGKYNIQSDINAKKIAGITEGMSHALINEVIMAAAKKALIDGSVNTSDLVSIIIKQKTKYSRNSEETIQAICEMLESGMSYRAIASAMGIPHSTLQYRVEKYRGIQ
ncbi:MAG: AAA family ATPase [Prevotella sp.]|nr:AAA family ATPase [Prevotella sp.]